MPTLTREKAAALAELAAAFGPDFLDSLMAAADDDTRAALGAGRATLKARLQPDPAAAAAFPALYRQASRKAMQPPGAAAERELQQALADLRTEMPDADIVTMLRQWSEAKRAERNQTQRSKAAAAAIAEVGERFRTRNY